MNHTKTLLAVDLRRLFRSGFFRILTGICFAMPILILVMTTMMDGSVTVNPETGVETVIKGFDHVWQIIGTVSGSSNGAEMDMLSMCNINLLYFLVSVPVCVFVSKDFRSGYAKNLFSIRTKKGGYVLSKMITCTLCAMLLVLVFTVGALLGGVIAGLPFDMTGFTAANLALCLLSKLLLMPVFTAIDLCMSVIAKEKTWLSILLSMAVGMLLFMMIPMLTPLNAGMMHVLLCLAGGVLFGVGLGAVSRLILQKRDIL